MLSMLITMLLMLIMLINMLIMLIIMISMLITVQFQLVVDGVFAAPLSETRSTQLACAFRRP